MEKQLKFYLTLPFVAVVTLALLAVPLVAMQFTNEVDWGAGDFLIMGALIFGTGSLCVLALRSATNMAYRLSMILAIGTTFFMIWANLAVGLIGSGPNAGNLMYAGVVAVLITGVYLSKFKALGLERAMFATAFALALLAVIALLMNLQSYANSSVFEIIAVNLFFITPFIISGLLFRYVRLQESAAVNNK